MTFSKILGSVRLTSEYLRVASDFLVHFRFRAHVPSTWILSHRPFRGVFNGTAPFMWRSNVLRLRQCSSTTTIHHGLRPRWYSSERSLPITKEEFESALKKVIRWEPTTQSNRPIGMQITSRLDVVRTNGENLGFAISGGVDSMALASLYAQAQTAHRFLPRAHGFIVDHKVRPESTEEAEWVAQQLQLKCRKP